MHPISVIRETREPGDNIIDWFNKVASDLVQGHLFCVLLIRKFSSLSLAYV